jgi:flagellar basal-body rod protein FlgB
MDNKLTQLVFNKLEIPRFEKFLNLSSLRHKLIAGNVANVATPGYEAKEINFDKEFARATGESHSLAGVTTHERHLPVGEHQSRAPRVHSTKVEGDAMNSVDIDHEISQLAQNELMYTVAARLIKGKFEGLRNAITSK